MPRVIHGPGAGGRVTVEVPGLPARGDNVMARSYARAAGGAVNIMLAAARRGGDVRRTGRDRHGRERRPRARGPRIRGCHVVDAAGSGRRHRRLLRHGRAQRRADLRHHHGRRAAHLRMESLALADPQAGDVVCVTGYSLAVASTRDRCSPGCRRCRTPSRSSWTRAPPSLACPPRCGPRCWP